MPLVAIRLEASLWEPASETRREEWRLVIRELLEEYCMEFPQEDITVHVQRSAEDTRLCCVDAAGRKCAEARIPASVLGPCLHSYVTVCRMMEDVGQASAQLETLDMAKKLTHDDAARSLAPFLATFAPNHTTCRRIFTLLLTVHVDTTALSSYHGHALPRS